jgi:hypothetical protein
MIKSHSHRSRSQGNVEGYGMRKVLGMTGFLFVVD